jgi:hypothetical protein
VLSFYIADVITRIDEGRFVFLPSVTAFDGVLADRAHSFDQYYFVHRFIFWSLYCAALPDVLSFHRRAGELKPQTKS